MRYIQLIVLSITLITLASCAGNPYAGPFDMGKQQYPRYDRGELEQYVYGGYYYYRGWQP